MVSLDEVIKCMEDCQSMVVVCEPTCPMWKAVDPECEKEQLALYYLKEYRETKKHLACLDDAEIRGDDTQVVNNHPLTWDELRQMEGKAVWIEGTHHKHWCIIKGIARKDLSEMEYVTLAYLNNKNRIVTYDRRKGNFDVTWQAYRKERG